MSTNIYSIDQKISEIFDIESSNLIPNSVFDEIHEDELFHSHGPSFMKGKKHTEETKKKMSESRMGQRNALGTKHSKETRQKIANANIGKKRDHVDWSTNRLRGNDRTESQKRQSKEHSERMRGRSAHNRKKIVFRNIEFDAVTHAMKHFNLSATTFYNELRNN